MSARLSSEARTEFFFLRGDASPVDEGGGWCRDGS